MDEKEFKVGEMVSFIHAGKKINGKIEYILEKDDQNSFFNSGDCVIKPHSRYRIEGYIVLPECHLQKLLEENNYE